MKKIFLLLCFLFGIMCSNIQAQTYVIKGVTYPIPEAIDLGLPSGVKWANMNMGALSVNEIGGYYGWADPTGELSVDNYNWRNVDLDGAWTSPLFGGTNPPRDISGTNLDIATTKLGVEWCMPSSDDFKELTENCTFTVESDYVKVTGPNGNSIILPISGSIFKGKKNQELQNFIHFINSNYMNEIPKGKIFMESLLIEENNKDINYNIYGDECIIFEIEWDILIQILSILIIILMSLIL